MKKKLANLFGRKFLLAAAGVAIGAIMISQNQVINGSCLVFASVLSFSVVEGVVDAKSLSTAVGNVAEAAKLVADTTGNSIAKTVETAAETLQSNITSEEKVLSNADGTGTSDEAAQETQTAQTSTPTGLSITYDGNGSDGGSAPLDTVSYNAGNTAVARENTGSLTRAGSIFNGWNTAKDGTGITVAPGAKLTLGTVSVTLYAVWVAESVAA